MEGAQSGSLQSTITEHRTRHEQSSCYQYNEGAGCHRALLAGDKSRQHRLDFRSDSTGPRNHGSSGRRDRAKTRQVFANLIATQEAAGSTLDTSKINISLTDLKLQRG